MTVIVHAPKSGKVHLASECVDPENCPFRKPGEQNPWASKALTTEVPTPLAIIEATGLA